MPLEVACPSCDGKFRIPDTAAGKKIRCPKCKGAIDVPAAGAVPAAHAALPPPPPQPSPAPASANEPTAIYLPPVSAGPWRVEPAATPLPAVKNERQPAAPPPPSPIAVNEWALKVADGEEYGPVSRTQLDAWKEEGRITAECHLQRSGQRLWQGAAEVYPDLAAEPEPPGPPASQPPAAKQAPSKPARSKPTPRPDEEQDFTRSSRSKAIAGILGIFLAPLGIHRFYLGYWGIGLAMLFTGGGCGIWSVIDAVMVLLGKVPDADGRPLSD